jgi:hypothetical protein
MAGNFLKLGQPSQQFCLMEILTLLFDRSISRALQTVLMQVGCPLQLSMHPSV